MTRLDFTPIFRTTVGFDRMMNVLDAMAKPEVATVDHPPYNIEKLGEDTYRITLAVAGFSRAALEVEVRDATLFVRGKAPEQDGGQEYLHRGIAARDFERRFALADHVHVTDAHIDNGMLTVNLVHEVPEAKRPRQIEIEVAPPLTQVSGPKEAEASQDAA